MSCIDEDKRTLLSAKKDYTRLVTAGVIVEINDEYRDLMLFVLRKFTSKECTTIIKLHESDKTVSDIVDKSLGARVQQFLDRHLMVLEACLREAKRRKIRALECTFEYVEHM